LLFYITIEKAERKSNKTIIVRCIVVIISLLFQERDR